MLRTARVACFSLATALGVLGVAGGHVGEASAQTAPQTAHDAGARPVSPAGQGIAVLAIGNARQDAFDLARALYGSHLRPADLDEVRARVLAGDAPPANASRELRELAELRAGVTGEDAAGRRLLAGLAQQVGAQALIVVKVERAVAPVPPAAPAAATPVADGGDAGGAPEGGLSAVPAPPGPTAEGAGASTGDGGVASGNATPTTVVVARVFLADSGEFDAARYQPEPGLKGAAAWAATVASLQSRFPSLSRTVGPVAATAATPAAKVRSEGEKSSPFYTSPWFWGALGGAALLGGAFYFASRDTSSDPIHLQMRVPR